MSGLETRINGLLKARWDFGLLLALYTSLLFLSSSHTSTEILKKRLPLTLTPCNLPAVGNTSMRGTKSLRTDKILAVSGGQWCISASPNKSTAPSTRAVVATFPINGKLKHNSV